ncbi:MAG: alanine--tRNA ligase [Candidatus Kerfeldbacteria bacterium CG15_BIG_FIL_POST_REV_8_21_14_020_45_12]|uniref:Alanine--tRNA ligase n=1 Tax=Candidatus Kerfeldbacteria bacterium CG15_BIG_FIL_POST_REV_8_21_14_020_45_12 TaxID=2014247 RepID=A0A2M7H5F3_9BACT|nr:MAG: alanine--tRNA ligase [Candidatus Kerfeldbacteria bacterium CG15_BIG_FIL_POST_REV_8_21_14_020_45_12]PJA93057.1 MAG: alanine--tRNA ligase [Candidatus Kerfeldbacteria bacterium CG_4_9_14_3_um_filter_45_8]
MKTPNLTLNDIRTRFLAFFEQRGHAIIPSASVMPNNDPTLLFTNSGMYPLVPYLMGETHPEGTRLADSQKCIRTIDIDEVGDVSHLTFFEMLGFWSLGDYFKEDTIAWTYEFMTNPEKGIGLDPARLYVTCFEGEDKVPRDNEAAEIWKSVGMPEHRIYFLGRKDNWWELPGSSGPCGPDTEIFYDVSGTLGDMTHDEFVVANDNGAVIEIGNDVFMQFSKDGKGGLDPLPKKNVDVGWGLERLAVMVQGVPSVFDTDTFQSIIKRIEEVTGGSYDSADQQRSIRIMADHIRTVTFIIGDPFGVGPSNVDQGYIVRRLIRRAIREGKRLGADGLFVTAIAEVVIDQYSSAYPELSENRERIIAELSQEEEKFQKSIDNGLKEFEKLLAKDAQSISGADAFMLFSTYGFPLEMTVEIAKERGANVDEMSFDQEFEKHQKTSRAGAAKKFKGGLADHSIESRRLHTATHILHKALKNMLGEQIEQKGSNITPERLRFDFNYDEKLTDQEKVELERVANEVIEKDLPVYWKELDVDEAKAMGAIGYFDDEYARLGNKVKVYFIGQGDDLFAAEICGGPHVEHAGELGSFKITSEKSSSAGIRRIKAVVSANQGK